MSQIAAPALSPITTRRTVGDDVYEQLRRALMWGQFEPGQPITIDALAQEAGTSHMPVREALRRLVAENGLEMTRSGSARVPPISAARLDDICRARIQIEGMAAELASQQATPADIDRLGDLIADHERAAASGKIYDMLHSNQIFHFALYELSRSDVLAQFINILWLQMGPYMRLLTHSIAGKPGQPARPPETDRHRPILAAMRQGDAGLVRQLVGEDIAASQKLLRQVL